MTDKKELFIRQAALYAKFRPDYPPEMLEWILNQCSALSCLWDCGTGTGQVALALADKFDRVIATDVSTSQLEHAEKHPKIKYCQQPAEKTILPNLSVDLITVAQALHWFDHELFNKEVKRVLKPGGIFAAWCYGLVQTPHAELNKVIHKFYTEITAPYWAPERQHINNHYQDIPMAFPLLETPVFAIKKELSVEALTAYFATWSPVNTLIQETGESLIDSWLKPQLDSLSLPTIIVCQWPITLLVSRTV